MLQHPDVFEELFVYAHVLDNGSIITSLQFPAVITSDETTTHHYLIEFLRGGGGGGAPKNHLFSLVLVWEKFKSNLMIAVLYFHPPVCKASHFQRNFRTSLNVHWME